MGIGRIPIQSFRTNYPPLLLSKYQERIYYQNIKKEYIIKISRKYILQKYQESIYYKNIKKVYITKISRKYILQKYQERIYYKQQSVFQNNQNVPNKLKFSFMEDNNKVRYLTIESINYCINYASYTHKTMFHCINYATHTRQCFIA